MEKVKSYIKKYFRPFIRGNNPDFMIIGAQKCGTTSLHYYLGQHPKLVGTLPKELHYFDRYINYGYDLDWYRKHFFQFSFQKLLFFESTPSYLYHASVAVQIKELFPEIKLIVLLRDPVSRAFSAYNMFKTIWEKDELHRISQGLVPDEMNPIYKTFVHNRTTFPTFQEAIELELELIESNADKEPSILRRGLYADQLKTWFSFFDRDQLLIVHFKDLQYDLSKTLSTIFRFLEVSEVPITKIKQQPRHKGTYYSKLGNKEKSFLKDYYAKPNEELMELLGYDVRW